MQKIFNFTLTKTEKYLALGFVFTFFLSRLINLTILPIFTDEAIYIRWSEIIWSVRSLEGAASLVFIPLSDGKQPLFFWIGGFFMQFIPDHLWAGRFPAVISGFASMIGMWLLGHELFKNKKIAWLSALIYLVLPFTLLYDRMMLADAMLTMWGIWSMYLSLILLRTLNLKVAIVLGIVYGLGLLTKSPALFYWVLTPVTLLFIKNPNREPDESPLGITDYFFWKWDKDTWNIVLRWIGLYSLAVIIGNAMMSIQRVSGLYHMIGRKNTEFLISTEDFLERPFALFSGNMIGMSIWFLGYLGLALVICAAIGFIRGVIKLDKRIIYLFILFILPWVASASRAKVLYPRYLLFFTPQLLLIIAFGIYVILRYAGKLSYTSTKSIEVPLLVKSTLLTLILFSSLNFSYQILFSPTTAPFPLQDKEQYVEGWPSGYGVDEIYAFLKTEFEKNNKLAVGTEGTFGLMPFALQIKFYDKLYHAKPGESLFIDGYWPFINVPQKLVEYAVERPTYFLVYQQENEMNPKCPLEEVKRIEKPGGKTTIRLFKVKPQSTYDPIECQIKKE
ncbi:MAG: glycosyltransferase family 39 protein [bacterium]|nr:glycosyltransferase family 39 protein [bacterium]